MLEMEKVNNERFVIQAIYAKNMTLEASVSPVSLAETVAPEVDMRLRNSCVKADENVFEVSLEIEADATTSEGPAFKAKVQVAGIFQLFDDLPESELEAFLSIDCPRVLYPYLRETLSNMIARSGFPPLFIAYIDFDGLYRYHLSAETEQANNAVTH